MWIRQVFLGMLGISSGFAVAGGMFALLIALGIISRFAGKTHTAKYIFYYEDAAAIGGILGNLISIYEFPVPVGMVGVVSYGLFAGVFTGAWAMALTEIVDVIPIFSRRIRLKTGMPWIILSMALGRAVGAFIYAYYRM
ncbi:MAG TPA: stage V sporulation protein AB [Lachnospiraceae bacterium]|nr:stage V sporulation protein AB [Lachnospiraceae bacterium]